MSNLQIRVSGRVQGVGYREALRHEAENAGVTGWVRNRTDGSVEALLQGAPEAVASVLQWARRGPPAARVREICTAPPEEKFDRRYLGFERWPTA
jgi:acylphosphatase